MIDKKIVIAYLLSVPRRTLVITMSTWPLAADNSNNLLFSNRSQRQNGSTQDGLTLGSCKKFPCQLFLHHSFLLLYQSLHTSFQAHHPMAGQRKISSLSFQRLQKLSLWLWQQSFSIFLFLWAAFFISSFSNMSKDHPKLKILIWIMLAQSNRMKMMLWVDHLKLQMC